MRFIYAVSSTASKAKIVLGHMGEGLPFWLSDRFHWL
jgi:predicted TIM-barrel fold metal-dependent hydrolase